MNHAENVTLVNPTFHGKITSHSIPQGSEKDYTCDISSHYPICMHIIPIWLYKYALVISKSHSSSQSLRPDSPNNWRLILSKTFLTNDVSLLTVFSDCLFVSRFSEYVMLYHECENQNFRRNSLQCKKECCSNATLMRKKNLFVRITPINWVKH